MKSSKRWVFLPLLLLAIGATGWLRQWPVGLSEPDAGAYRIELTEGVYRTAHDAGLRDVAVIDANEQPVPAMLFAADAPVTGKAQQFNVPWFPLPDAGELPSSELRVISERATDGRVLRVETRDVANVDAPAPQSWLVDASALRSPVAALRLSLPNDAQVEARARVEGSDDLMNWRVLANDVGILQVTRDGQTLGQTRVPLPQSARYLRITQTSGEPLPLSAVSAETGPATLVVARQSRDFAPTITGNDRRAFEFSVDGLQPFDQADVVLPGNSAVSWRLESRDSAETPWQLRAGPWAQYRIGDAQRSRPQLLVPIRQRQWRLVSDVAVADTPKLRLSWQPEVLMFVASGKAPYRVVAGSVQHLRQDAPLGDLLAGIRADRGADWQPAIATIQGDGEPGDPDALRIPHDWKNYALWGVLLLAALLVVGFAVSLLRGNARRDDADQGPSSDAG